MAYLYCTHQALNFLFVEHRGDRSYDDLHRDVMNLCDVVGMNRPIVCTFDVHPRVVGSGHKHVR